MTLKEASKRFGISLEKLNAYEKYGLIVHETLVNDVPDYTEDELRKVGVIHVLMTAGMDIHIDLFPAHLRQSGEESRREGGASR